MNKKLLELLDQIGEKKALVQKLANEGRLEDAAKEKEDLKKLQQKFDILKDIEDAEDEKMKASLVDKTEIPGTKSMEPAKENATDHVKEFADAARGGFKNVTTGMTEGTGANGGYTVPEDIQTQINTYRDAEFSLLDLIDVETVTTNKGARTFQKKAQQTGFAKVSEGGKIGGKNGPQFERLEYEIEKFAGYFPVTNELLEDSDANITGTIVAWIGGESRATANVQILVEIAKKQVTDLKDIDGIQKAIIVTLGAAYAGTSKIVTNDDGLLYLSTLKDTNGNYLLRNANNDPMKKVLAVGAMSVPIEVIGNSVLKSNTATAKKRGIPFIIGDLKEGIKKFDRKQITIVASDTAAVTDFNAFEQDMTLFRAIEREDYVTKDPDAFVNGMITVDDAAVTGE